MIKEAYCSYEVSKLLKKKGFVIDTSLDYWKIDLDGTMYSISPKVYAFYRPKDSYPCPTLQMACRWLREIHGIHIEALCPVVDIDTNTNGVKYNVVISNLNNYCLAYDTPIEDNEYDSYEEAIEAACLYVLKNII